MASNSTLDGPEYYGYIDMGRWETPSSFRLSSFHRLEKNGRAADTPLPPQIAGQMTGTRRSKGSCGWPSEVPCKDK